MDGDLSEKEHHVIQEHLKHCVHCSNRATLLTGLYSSSEKIETVSSPHFLWEKLYQKIDRYENSYSPIKNFFEIAPRYAASFVVIISFILAIFAGIYLGSYPNFQDSETFASTMESTDKDEFVKEAYIDSFDDIPSESLGGVYLTLKTE